MQGNIATIPPRCFTLHQLEQVQRHPHRHDRAAAHENGGGSLAAPGGSRSVARPITPASPNVRHTISNMTLPTPGGNSRWPGVRKCCSSCASTPANSARSRAAIWRSISRPCVNKRAGRAGTHRAHPCKRSGTPGCRFVVAIVAQRLQVPLEFRLGLRQFEGRQHPAEVGAVAAIVEQRNVPVRAQRLQEFQQRARRLRKLKAVQPFAQRLRRTPTHHVPHVKFGHRRPTDPPPDNRRH